MLKARLSVISGGLRTFLGVRSCFFNVIFSFEAQEFLVCDIARELIPLLENVGHARFAAH